MKMSKLSEIPLIIEKSSGVSLEQKTRGTKGQTSSVEAFKDPESMLSQSKSQNESRNQNSRAAADQQSISECYSKSCAAPRQKVVPFKSLSQKQSIIVSKKASRKPKWRSEVEHVQCSDSDCSELIIIYIYSIYSSSNSVETVTGLSYDQTQACDQLRYRNC
jgi:hypothetical protein